MNKSKLTSVAALLMIGSVALASAYAQDTAIPDAQAAPANNAPQWLVGCSNQVDAERLTCTMSQSVVVAATGARLLTAVVQPSGESGRELAFVLPFGLDLQKGVQLVLDDADWQNIPVTTCEAGACLSTLPLDADAISALSKGTALDVKLMNSGGEEVVLSLTLEGFTKSMRLMQ